MNPRHFQPWTAPPALLSHVDSIFRRTQMPAQGREYVKHTMSTGPARPVQAHNGGTCVRHYSNKMGATMMLESRRGESVLAWMLECAAGVKAYFAQPTSVDLNIMRADGSRATRTRYTPDFMVIEQQRICIKEVRDGARFYADSQKHPDRYFRDSDGTYRNLPAEQHYKALGLDYEFLVVSELPHRLVENLRFLEDYYRESCPPLADEQRKAVVDRVGADRWVPLRALLNDGIPSDWVYKAITEQAVHVPLETTRLSDTDNVKLFMDEATAQVHAQIGALSAEPPPPIPGTLMLRSGSILTIYDREYHVLLQGERDVMLRDSLGVSVSKSVDEIRLLHERGDAKGEAFRLHSDRTGLWAAPQHKIEKAMRRLRAARDPNQSEYSERSIARFRARVEGAANDIEAVELLIDNEDKRGNTKPRFSEPHEELIQKAIDDHYNTGDLPTAKGAYEKYVKSLEDVKEPGGASIEPVSIQTFSRRCKQRTCVRAREGKRAAYQQGRIVPLLGNEHVAHGLRQHEVLYVDHTTADIETISPQGKPLGKPTLTMAIDGCTRHVPAFVVMYEPPSAKVVMLLIRAYIAKYNRVPRVIVVDNGKEFHSHEFEFLCRTYGIEIRYRAPGQPRGGSLIERSFGAVNEEVLAELEGNSRSMKTSARQRTGDMLPANRACWTLTAVHGAIAKFLFEEHPNRVHPELGVTPNEYEERRTAETGVRDHMVVHLDENAMLLTSPHPQRRPKRKVIKGRGVNVYGIYYQHPAFQTVKPGTSVEVRVEWWNASVVYAQVGGRWVTAVGTSARFLSERGNHEIEMAYRAHNKQAREDARKDAKQRAGKSFRAVKLLPEHFDPLLAIQQAEVRRLYEAQGAMGAAAMTTPRAAAANDSPSSQSAEVSQSDEASADVGGRLLASAAMTPVQVAPSANAPKSDPSDDDDDDDPVYRITGTDLGLR
jgi:putative transposase